jgi:hypothetical protein
MSRSSQYSVAVTVDDVDLGVFDSFEGGAGSSEETKYRPGGMGDEVSLGGQQTRENFTVARLYRQDRDHSRAHWLDGRRGRAKVVAKKQPLDADRNPFGRPLVYTGTLLTVSFPDHDSQSDDPAVLSLEVVADGPIA